jgi:hypothetical protein
MERQQIVDLPVVELGRVQPDRLKEELRRLLWTQQPPKQTRLSAYPDQSANESANRQNAESDTGIPQQSTAPQSVELCTEFFDKPVGAFCIQNCVQTPIRMHALELWSTACAIHTVSCSLDAVACPFRSTKHTNKSCGHRTNVLTHASPLNTKRYQPQSCLRCRPQRSVSQSPCRRLLVTPIAFQYLPPPLCSLFLPSRQHRERYKCQA